MGSTDPSGEGPGLANQDTDVDVLVVGAGVVGIYQLYLAREAGYSVRMLEAGSGVGGTWYWNRYPGARYDSESYTYAYLFSDELFQEWVWTEHFSGQLENERYFNHVVDKFGLRRHIRFNTRVTSADWDESSATWLVRADGYAIRARHLVAATGVLSVPAYPQVPGRETFRGEAYHTGLWPKEPVDFAGKRVAVIGTGSSGVQIIPEIAGEVAALTVYQRTPNWATPLNNRPITPQEQAELRANFPAMRETLNKSLSGFLHTPSGRNTFDDSPEERQAFYEQLWSAPGFGKIIRNYSDMMLDPAANAEWSQFVANKIRGIVEDQATADKLIPTDHGYGGKRPPYVTDYYEAYNRPNVTLVDLRETPITAVTETGIAVSNQETRRSCGSSTSSCGPPDSTSVPAPSTGSESAAGTVFRSRSTGPTARSPTSASWPVTSRTSTSPAARTAPPATTRGTRATKRTSSPACSATRVSTGTG
jgi:cation diffusion facilitator CzcD-associated flavoprotein CzcO